MSSSAEQPSLQTLGEWLQSHPKPISVQTAALFVAQVADLCQAALDSGRAISPPTLATVWLHPAAFLTAHNGGGLAEYTPTLENEVHAPEWPLSDASVVCDQEP